MSKKISIVILLLFMTIIITSCFDAVEVDDLSYITTIGVDKGIADKWRFSFQVATMAPGSEEQSSGNPGGIWGNVQYTTLSIDSASFFQAIDAIDTNLARSLNFMHNKYIIISREVAEKGTFAEVIAPIIRFREVRRTTNVIVSTCTAEHLIESLKPRIGISMPKLQEGLIKQSEETGFFPSVDLSDYYGALKSSSVQPIAAMGGVNNFEHFPKAGTDEKDTPQLVLGERHAGELPRKGGNEVEFFGTAIFDGDKMVYELNGYKTRVMLMMRGEYKRGAFSTADPLKPDQEIVVRLKQRVKPKIKVTFDDDRPIIHIKINLDGYILAIQSRINYEAVDKIGYLENTISSIIEKEANELVAIAKNLKVDFLNLGFSAVKYFYTIKEWEEFNWAEKFQDAKVIVEADTRIRSTGTMVKSSPIKGSGGQE